MPYSAYNLRIFKWRDNKSTLAKMTIFLAQEISTDKNKFAYFLTTRHKNLQYKFVAFLGCLFLTDLMKKNLCHEKCLINQTASLVICCRVGRWWCFFLSFDRASKKRGKSAEITHITFCYFVNYSRRICFKVLLRCSRGMSG